MCSLCVCSGYFIIKNCTGVITLSGTAGWEAFLLRKPSITFSNVFYNLAEKSVFNVKNFYELASLLQKIVEDFKPDEEIIKKIIVAKYHFTYPGKMYPLNPWDEVIPKENLKNLSNAIISEYNIMKSENDNKKV